MYKCQKEAKGSPKTRTGDFVIKKKNLSQDERGFGKWVPLAREGARSSHTKPDRAAKGVDNAILAKDSGGHVKSGCGHVYEVIFRKVN